MAFANWRTPHLSQAQIASPANGHIGRERLAELRKETERLRPVDPHPDARQFEICNKNGERTMTRMISVVTAVLALAGCASKEPTPIYCAPVEPPDYVQYRVSILHAGTSNADNRTRRVGTSTGCA